MSITAPVRRPDLKQMLSKVPEVTLYSRPTSISGSRARR